LAIKIHVNVQLIILAINFMLFGCSARDLCEMVADRVAQLGPPDRVSKSRSPFPISQIPRANGQRREPAFQTLSQFSNIYFYVRNANNLRFVLAKLKSHTEAENRQPEEFGSRRPGGLPRSA